MKMGTKSLLFGAHQFILHPLAVAYSWMLLFGFPWDPRLWVAFFVHDFGYWGKPNMDGHEGANHPRLGADIMHRLFDWPRFRVEHFKSVSIFHSNYRWYNFTIKHSRRFSKGQEVSRLCPADKLALIVTPAWLYRLMVKATGEWEEYADMSGVPAVDPQDDRTRYDRWYNDARYGICKFVLDWRVDNA